VHAVAPDGRVAWTLRTPGRVANATWSPDGYRVAYRRAGGLGLVAGDGTAPRLLAASVVPAGPAWQPGTPHTLAWVDTSGRIVVRDVDTGGLVWRSADRLGSARALSWSADGALLLIQASDGLRLADVRTRRVERVALPAGDRPVAAAWAPAGRRLAVVARGLERPDPRPRRPRRYPHRRPPGLHDDRPPRVAGLVPRRLARARPVGRRRRVAPAATGAGGWCRARRRSISASATRC